MVCNDNCETDVSPLPHWFHWFLKPMDSGYPMETVPTWVSDRTSFRPRHLRCLRRRHHRDCRFRRSETESGRVGADDDDDFASFRWRKEEVDAAKEERGRKIRRGKRMNGALGGDKTRACGQ